MGSVWGERESSPRSSPGDRCPVVADVFWRIAGPTAGVRNLSGVSEQGASYTDQVKCLKGVVPRSAILGFQSPANDGHERAMRISSTREVTPSLCIDRALYVAWCFKGGTWAEVGAL